MLLPSIGLLPSFLSFKFFSHCLLHLQPNSFNPRSKYDRRFLGSSKLRSKRHDLRLIRGTQLFNLMLRHRQYLSNQIFLSWRELHLRLLLRRWRWRLPPSYSHPTNRWRAELSWPLLALERPCRHILRRHRSWPRRFYHGRDETAVNQTHQKESLKDRVGELGSLFEEFGRTRGVVGDKVLHL